MIDEVKNTNGIPICPHCKKPTKRTTGMSTCTMMYFAPIYNEEGINTNPDRNIHTTEYYCYGCGKGYTVRGNHVNGYSYSK